LKWVPHRYGFDIPVKVFAVHLLLIAIFVLAGDLARLANFLLLNRPTPPANNGVPWRGGGFRTARFSLKTVFVLYDLASSVQACLAIRHTRRNRSPLYRIYAVEEFSANGTARAPLITDTARWKTVVFSSPERIWIKHMDDSIQGLPAKANREFATGLRRQSPIGIAQTGLTYTITSRVCAAFSANLYTGGRTSIGGLGRADYLHNTLMGGTFSLRLTRHQSVKFHGSRGVVRNIGAAFVSIGGAYQYVWGSGL
jgi:hypothetical protein